MRTVLVLCVLLSSAANASSIDKDLVRRIISTKNAAFRGCYETALRFAGPNFSGKAVLKIAIDPDGVVTRVDVDFPIPSEKFTSCLRDAALELRFPKFGGGGQIQISWPITFAAAG